MTAERLDKALRAAGVPIVGVSIGTLADKSTWMVQYADGATPQHIDQAKALIAAYADPDAATLLDEEAQRRLLDKATVAALMALYEAIPTPTRTLPQVRARAIVIFKTLP